VRYTRLEGVNLASGGAELGDAKRELRLSHGKGIEHLANELHLTALRNEVSRKQLMQHSPGGAGMRVRHIFRIGFVGRRNQDVDVIRRESNVWVERQ
jgi:hypothetical protein